MERRADCREKALSEVSICKFHTPSFALLPEGIAIDLKPDVTRQLHNSATFYQSHSAAAPYRQPNFETPKSLVPNLGIGNAIALETPVSTEFFGSKLGFRAHFHSQTGVWERAVMRCWFRLSLGNALLRVTSVKTLLLASILWTRDAN